MNGEYFKAMDPEKFYEKAEPWLKQAITKPEIDLKQLSEMVRTRAEVFPEIPDMIRFFETLPDYDTALFDNKKQKATKENSLQILEEMLPIFEKEEHFTNDALFADIAAYAEEKGFKNKTVIWVVRIAVSGQAVTPAGATQIMEILGRDESLARLRKAVAKLQA
jgi:glutamyl/glutaminyl-tRNA synthetase